MAVAPLRQAQFKPGVLLSFPQNGGRSNPQPFTLTIRARPQRRQQRRIGQTIHLHVITLLQAAPRRRHTGRPGVIITEQQQPFAGLIQPPHWRQSWPVRSLPQRGKYGGATPLIPTGGHQTAGLVEHEIARRCRLHGRAVQGQSILAKAQTPQGIPHDAAIHGDPAGTHGGLGLGAGAHAQLGQGAHERERVIQLGHGTSLIHRKRATAAKPIDGAISSLTVRSKSA